MGDDRVYTASTTEIWVIAATAAWTALLAIGRANGFHPLHIQLILGALGISAPVFTLFAIGSWLRSRRAGRSR